MSARTSKQPVISGALLLIGLAAIVPLQYYLVNKPVAVDVVSDKIAPITAKLNQEELLVEDAVDDSDGILFLMDGQVDESINIRFDKARLSENTRERFANKPTPPPTGVEIIDFISEDVRREIERQPPARRRALEALISQFNKATDSNENSVCRTLIKAEVASGSKFPTKQRFYQTNEADPIRDFYFSVDTDLLVSIKISQRIDDKVPYNPFGPGCGKLLKVGDSWQASNPGYWEISVIAPANSIIHFTLIQDKKDSLWKEPTDLFEPFEFGSKPLRANGVTVQSLATNATAARSAPPRLTVNAAKGQPLAINKFSLNNEMIQLDFSGTAWVKTNGEPVTENVLATVTKYPIFNGALLLGIATLLGWFAKSIKDMFKRKPVDDSVKSDDG